MKFILTIALLSIILGISWGIPERVKTTRAPAYPLAVRTPYNSIWLKTEELPGTWPQFWTDNSIKGWTGMVRVDGSSYIYMGNPAAGGEPMAPLATQNSRTITPTRTIFELTAGPVDLTVTFLSPVEYADMMRQSIPLSYVTVSVRSNDGSDHNVQLYMDISGEWASSDSAAEIIWTPSDFGSLKMWTTELTTQDQFREFAEYPQWGQAVFVASSESTSMSGSDVDVRQSFLDNGQLPNTHDENYRCISCDWPTFGFAYDFGPVSTEDLSQVYVVGHVRRDNINFLGEPRASLWVDYWSTMEEMVTFFYGDLDTANQNADALDEKITTDALAAGGQAYLEILIMSLRQSFGAHEFSGTQDDPVLYQKEISSGGFVQTVDVIYPTTPMYYYLNIEYLRLVLKPLFYQMENEVWTKPFAMHDIGAPYPNALGQAYGGDMPVEESANMIMMVANYVFHPDIDADQGLQYAQDHFPIMSQWAEYLYFNCLYPVDQLTTDDFIGPTELNSGLALKGILGMKTFSRLAEVVGDANATSFYAQAVEEYVPIWIEESLHADGTHLKMEYNVSDGYQFKYNAYHDKLLKLDVVPEEIYQLEADYYLTLLEPYGIPFVSTHDYTKSDWEIWTAAAFGDANPELRTSLIEALAKFLEVSAQRVPFTDWYVTATANHVGFSTRPVQGGHFALLSLIRSNQ